MTSFDIVYPGWIQKKITNGRVNRGNTFYDGIVISGKVGEDFEIIKHMDKSLNNGILTTQMFGENTLQVFTHSLVKMIDNKITEIVRKIQTFSMLSSFGKGDLNYLSKEMKEYFKSIDYLKVIISTDSKKRCRKIITTDNYMRYSEHIGKMKDTIDEIISINYKQNAIVTRRSIHCFLELSTLLGSCVDFVSDKTEKMVDTLESELTDIEGDGGRLSDGNKEKAENIRKVKCKLNTFKNGQLFEHISKFELLEKRNEDLTLYLDNIKRILQNLLAIFTQSLKNKKGCKCDKTLFKANISNILRERMNMQKNYTDVFSVEENSETDQ